jgi:hypothetical protein
MTHIISTYDDHDSSLPWALTHHCRWRARQMNLTRSEVLEVLDDPEVTYCSGGDRRTSQRGGLAVVWDTRSLRAITVLYRQAEQWRRPG